MQYADGLPSTIKHPVASADNRFNKRPQIPAAHPLSSTSNTTPLVLPSRPPRPHPGLPKKVHDLSNYFKSNRTLSEIPLNCMFNMFINNGRFRKETSVIWAYL